MTMPQLITQSQVEGKKALGYYGNEIFDHIHNKGISIPRRVKASGKHIINQGDAKALEFLAQTILRRFPPPNYAYLNIGNSPALLLTYLQTNFRDQNPLVLHLPFSDVKSESYKGWKNETAKARMIKYLDKWIRPDMLRGKKNLVLFDVVAEGRAIANIQYLLENYFKHKNYLVTLHLQPLNNDKEGLTIPRIENVQEPRFSLFNYAPGFKGVEGDVTQFLSGIAGRSFKDDAQLKMWSGPAMNKVFEKDNVLPDLLVAHYQRMLIETQRAKQRALQK